MATNREVKYEFINMDGNIAKTDIRSIARLASRISDINRNTKEYNCRILLELLQNADDAARKEFQNTNRVCDTMEVVLTPRHLAVLNQGIKFTEDTLTSLIYKGISIKRTDKDLTGAKGVGFTGVLNWSQDIKIYSGDIAVEFSTALRDKALSHIANREELERALFTFNNLKYRLDDVSILDFGGDVDFPSEWQNGKYRGIYDTCIQLTLPHDNNKTFNEICQAIRQFIATDITSMLFMKHVKHIIFDITDDAGNHTKQKVHIDITPGAPSVATIRKIGDADEARNQFLIFESDGNKIAIPAQWKYNPDEKQKLHFVFPMNGQACPFPVIMHGAKFEPVNNRENLIGQDQGTIDSANQLKDLLIDVVAPYCAAHGTPLQALEIISAQESNLPYPFNDAEHNERFFAKIRAAKIIPTTDGGFTSLDDEPYQIPICQDWPDIIHSNKIITSDAYNQVKKLKYLATLIPSIEADDLRDIINAQSHGWSVSERVQVMHFWLNNYSDKTPPKLLRDKHGNLHQFENTEETKLFFYTGNKLDMMPTWLDIPFMHPEDQQELTSTTEVPPTSNHKGKPDRYLSEIHTDLFNYFDKTRVAQKINSGVQGNFGHAVDLVKFIYANYKNPSSNNESDGGGIAGVTWNMPIANGDVMPSGRVYFGANYCENPDNPDIDVQIFDALDNFHALAGPEQFGISPDEHAAFRHVIATQCKVHTDILPRNDCFLYAPDEYTKDQLPRDKKTICLNPKAVMDSYEYLDRGDYLADARFKALEIQYIPNLDLILSVCDQDLIIPWAIKIFNYISPKTNATLFTSRAKNGKTVMNIDSLILYKLRTTKWLNISGESYAPNQCIMDKDTAIAGLLPQIPYPVHKNLWTAIGVARNIPDLPAETFYKVMMELPRHDTNGVISKKIYNQIAASDANLDHLKRAHKQPFIDNGFVWTQRRKANTEGFTRVKDSFCTGKRVPNLANKPIMMTPIRKGATKFCEVFGVREFEENTRAVYDECAPHKDNDTLQEQLKEFYPYLRALSLSDNLNNALKKLHIDIMEHIVLEDPTSPTDFDDYNIVPTRTSDKWCIYLSKDTRLTKYLVAPIIGEICNTINNSADIADTVELLFCAESNEHRLQILKNKNCSLAPQDNDQDRQDFIQAAHKINPNIDITLLINDIDFDDVTAPENGPVIVKILNQLNATVADFAEHGFDKIDLVPYNRQKLEQYINKNRHKYQTWAYHTAIENKELQEKLIEDFDKFDNLISDKRLKEPDFDPTKEKPVHDIDGMTPYSDAGYNRNLAQLQSEYSAAVISELVQKTQIKSLMHFDERMDEVRTMANEIKAKFVQIDKAENATPQSDTNAPATIATINNCDGEPIAVRPKKSGTSRGGGRGAVSQITQHQKQINGRAAEQIAYNSLCDKYGKDKVFWRSGNSNTIHGGNDTLGYDMEYIDENNLRHYVEVKSASKSGNAYGFIVTKHEEDVAREKGDMYSLFLVTNDNGIQEI
ncbi:DUF3883 domain-containing protein, partial [bacterium]|nr:DUF3883 domain-containing protein [bacterium]